MESSAEESCEGSAKISVMACLTEDDEWAMGLRESSVKIAQTFHQAHQRELETRKWDPARVVKAARAGPKPSLPALVAKLAVFVAEPYFCTEVSFPTLDSTKLVSCVGTARQVRKLALANTGSHQSENKCSPRRTNVRRHDQLLATREPIRAPQPGPKPDGSPVGCKRRTCAQPRHNERN